MAMWLGFWHGIHGNIPISTLSPIQAEDKYYQVLPITLSLALDNTGVPRLEGCFEDNGAARDLSAVYFQDDAMTTDICTVLCSNQHYKYAALQASTVQSGRFKEHSNLSNIFIILIISPLNINWFMSLQAVFHLSICSSSWGGGIEYLLT